MRMHTCRDRCKDNQQDLPATPTQIHAHLNIHTRKGKAVVRRQGRTKIGWRSVGVHGCVSVVCKTYNLRTKLQNQAARVVRRISNWTLQSLINERLS